MNTVTRTLEGLTVAAGDLFICPSLPVVSIAFPATFGSLTFPDRRNAAFASSSCVGASCSRFLGELSVRSNRITGTALDKQAQYRGQDRI